MERLSDYIQGERVVRELRRYAPEALEEMARDLEQPLSPPLEKALARTLDDRRVPDFAASEVLMPAMMTTLAVDPATITAEELVGLEETCNRCSEAGRCWQAMRDYADAEACRAFCPNAEAFMGRGVEEADTAS